MANITLQGNPVNTIGNLPSIGKKAPAFILVDSSLADVKLFDFTETTVVLNIFPSLDTEVCAASVRRFNSEAASLPNTVILCISADLPFAHKRFCVTEGIRDVITLSTFRSPEFGREYGVFMTTGPLSGLLSRAVVVIDRKGTVIYTEQVSELAEEPDYAKVMANIFHKAP